MLTTLRIDPDAPQNWAWDGTKYVAVGGLIEPCPHPMIEQAAAPSRTAPG